MATHNGANARIKRAYFHYLGEAKRHSALSVDAVAKAISRFEYATGHRDFRKFHREQAVAFKRKLGEGTNVRTGKPLSKATIDGTLRALRDFFIWLAGQPGYKSRIQYADADYFNLSDKDRAIARAKRPKRVPTLEQLHYILAGMQHTTPMQMRDRAVVATAVLTGARDGALASFRLKHVDLAQSMVFQDGRDVRTKFSKSFPTWFFPIGGDALAILTEWIGWLRSEQHWGDDDPLFPSTQVGLSESGVFAATGLQRKPWSSAAPIREIFRKACEGAGLPYFNPHSLRDMLAQLGERLCRTPEEFKAWSQNLGHAEVLTTLTSYGAVPAHRQSELIRALARLEETTGLQNDPIVFELLERLRSQGVRR